MRSGGARPRFAFLVHPLVPWHRQVLGVRRAHVPMFFGQGTDIGAVGTIARLGMPSAEGRVDGLIVGVPALAHDLVADQARALAFQERAARIAIDAGAQVVGLGSALAVVAGRGAALAERVDVPVTTGHAATAWSCAEITRRVVTSRGRVPIGVLGFKGTVADAVAHRLAAWGYEVHVDASGRAARRAEQIGCVPGTVDDVVGRCGVLVGGATTGPMLSPATLRDGTVLVDLALPPTLEPGPRPPGVRVVAGETVSIPGRVHGGFWGRVWLGITAYGRGVVYACLAEPLAVAALGRSFGGGRRLSLDDLDQVGNALTRLGYVPVVRER